MRPDGIKLSHLQRRTFYAAFAVLFVTGVAWSVLHDGLAWLGYDDDSSRYSIVPTLLELHGAAAMVALVALGSLVPQHIEWAWTGRINRLTGVVMLGTQALLVGTGYALYYAGDEAVRTYASDLHLFVGLGFPLILVGHIVEGRRRRAAMRARSASPVHSLQEGLYASLDARAVEMAQQRKASS